MKKNFWLYTTGMVISFIGSGVQDIALPLFILDLTGSGTVMGTFMIVTVVPRLLLYPVAGVIGDRVNRKWIMVLMDFGRGIVIIILAALAARTLLSIPVLFAAQIAVSLMSTLFGPATIAMLPDIVKEEDLMRANSITESVSSFSYIIGPILGGVIYGLGGITLAFIVNGVSFFGSGAAELFIKYSQKTKKFEKVTDVITDLKEGITFIKIHKGLLILLVTGLAINVLVGPVLMVLIPYVLRVIIKFSSEQYGILQTAFMAGALLGNIIIGSVLAKTKVEPLLTRGFIAQVLVMGVFVVLISPHVIESLQYASWILFSAIFCTFICLGTASAFVNTPINVGFQKLAPTEYRARVFSVSGVIIQGVVPIGYGVMGILLDIFPVHLIAATMVALEFIVVFLFIFKYVKVVSSEFEQ
jgi:MFS family permease